MKDCPICHSEMDFIFSEPVLRKHEVKYYCCGSCQFIQTEKPYWLEEAYSDAIADSDTGILHRNWLISCKLAVLILLSLGKRNLFLDIAGGYGLLVRLMRDFGFNYRWSDPYCKNIFALGYEASPLSTDRYQALTAFEVLEHVESPIDFISENLQKFNSGIFIFSTELFQNYKVPKRSWRYYSFPTGQHISFYSQRALEEISKKLAMHFYTFGGIYIFSKDKLSFVWLVRLLTARKASIALSLFFGCFLKSKTVEDSQHVLHHGIKK